MTDTYDPLVDEARALRKKFEERIEPYRQDLWSYCRYLTGSPWDGEDLFQETILKAYAMMAQIWHPLAYKSYLFRIATNTRIDRLRKKEFPLSPVTEAHVTELPDPSPDPLQLIEALEVLVQQLPPRQIATFLLMEMYGFSAPEVASMVRMTEGSVYAVLYRARAGVRKYREHRAAPVRDTREPVHAALLARLLNTLRSGDVETLLAMFDEGMHNDASPGFQEYSKTEMREGSYRHRGPALQVDLHSLWGREVFVVMAQTERGLELHDIREFVFEGGRIVYHRGHYFCKELLLAAGQTLGVPVQLQKDPGLDWRQSP